MVGEPQVAPGYRPIYLADRFYFVILARTV